MDATEEFIAQYEREFDYWQAAAQSAAALLERELVNAGLRAIVTSRAKSVESLHRKLIRRNAKKSYQSAEDIRADIVDLAGVRIALYFPGQMDEVEHIIRSHFDVQIVKQFPGTAGKEHAERGYDKRFSGYGARHFRVTLQAGLSGSAEHYAGAPIEIQLASVLMHAWSEVEHDLVYKPLHGELSASEYALLDQLNGLILAGEIALQQLQKAEDERVASARTPFRDHYELAEFIRATLAGSGVDLTDSTLGRVDVLFEYLREQEEATASAIEPYFDELTQDFEHRPVAEQLADLMLSGSPEHYRSFIHAMEVAGKAGQHVAIPSAGSATTQPMPHQPSENPEEPELTMEQAVERFISSWIHFELAVGRVGGIGDTGEMAGQDAGATVRDRGRAALHTHITRRATLQSQVRWLAERGMITPEQLSKLGSVRELRNHIVHGNRNEVSPGQLVEIAQWLEDISTSLDAR